VVKKYRWTQGNSVEEQRIRKSLPVFLRVTKAFRGKSSSRSGKKGGRAENLDLKRGGERQGKSCRSTPRSRFKGTIVSQENLRDRKGGENRDYFIKGGLIGVSKIGGRKNRLGEERGRSNNGNVKGVSGKKTNCHASDRRNWENQTEQVRNKGEI